VKNRKRFNVLFIFLGSSFHTQCMNDRWIIKQEGVEDCTLEAKITENP
jgi:hypothetical protein